MNEPKPILKLLQECTYFQNMKECDLELLISFSIIKDFENDSIVFYQGEDSKYMHILLEGSIRVYKSKPSGGEVQLMRATAVNTVAELACFESIPYPATCVTTSKAKILKIPFTQFEKDFLSNPEISFGMIKSLSLKLRSLSSLIERELTLSSEQKVAKFIVENQNRFEKLKQVEIASELNITPETLSRMLRKLHKQNLLESTNPPIITDEEGLKEIYKLF
ncbi:Crp/Fnr family transcriptional regulator [Sulfurimonas sp. MAG313]|nr:Crp/Fnr family transcriptional regulator [Sulfurimonas sp. MAG313]MDF1880760.1 Crp/Fnr family transcriptional regulator [Sulfurimonas sp. MAG313]